MQSVIHTSCSIIPCSIEASGAFNPVGHYNSWEDDESNLTDSPTIMASNVGGGMKTSNAFHILCAPQSHLDLGPLLLEVIAPVPTSLRPGLLIIIRNALIDRRSLTIEHLKKFLREIGCVAETDMPHLSDLFAVPSTRYEEMRETISVLARAEEHPSKVPRNVDNAATSTDGVSSMTDDRDLGRAVPTSQSLAAMHSHLLAR